MTTITNGDLETLGAAVVAGSYGPLTRIGSVPAIDDNTEIEVEFECANGVKVMLSHKDLSRAAVRARKVAQAQGYNDIVATLKAQINALNTTVNAMSAPYTYANFKTITDTLKNIKQVRGF